MNLSRAILLVLESSPRALPETAILGTIPAYLPGNHTLTDLQHALKELEREGDARGTAKKDYGTVWMITAEGRLRLA